MSHGTARQAGPGGLPRLLVCSPLYVCFGFAMDGGAEPLQSRYLTHEGGAPGRAVGTRTVVDLCACASAAIAAPLLALQGASERTGGGMRVDKIAACNWHAISAAISMQSGSEQARVQRAACLRERSSRALCGENMGTLSGAVAIGAGDAAFTPPPPAVTAGGTLAAGGAAAAALSRSCSTSNSARVVAAWLSASRIESRHASSWMRRLLWNSAAGPAGSAPTVRAPPRAPGRPGLIGGTSRLWGTSRGRRRPGLARRKLLDSDRAPSCTSSTTPATARGTRSHSEDIESDGSEAEAPRLVPVGIDSTAALALPGAEAAPSPPTSSGGGRGPASRVAPAVAGRGAS